MGGWWAPPESRLGLEGRTVGVTYNLEPESFEDRVARLRPERAIRPRECSHCFTETTNLVNHSRDYGGNVGAHWLCPFCEDTISASRLGAGLQPDDTVRDVAHMLNLLASNLWTSGITRPKGPNQ